MTNSVPSILITPPWQEKSARIKAPKLPETLVISELPKLLLKDDTIPLPDDKVENLLGLLFKSDIKQWVEPLTDDSVKALIAEFEPTALQDFATALAKQVGIDWYGYAVLSPFDFDTVEQFRGLIDGKTECTDGNPLLFDKKLSQTSLAKQLIRLLAINFRITNSPHALQALFLQQQKGKKTYRNFCQETLSSLALSLGLTLIELQDLAVPDFGFVNGKRIVHLGEHELELRLDPHFQILMYQEGTLIKNFPKIGKTDDKEQWKQTIDEIKEQQKQLNKLSRELPKVIQTELKYQFSRKFQHFQHYYLNHTVLHQFAQTLVWAVFDYTKEDRFYYRRFRHAFLPSNDGSWLNSDYEDIKPMIENMVGDNPNAFSIVPLHPAMISEAEQSAFAQMLMDFEIIQPCPQLGMQIFRPTEAEWQAGLITRYDNVDLGYGEFSGVYRHSFTLLRNHTGELGIEFRNKRADVLQAKFVEPVKSYSVARVQIQPIAIDENTDKTLIHTMLEMLESAKNRVK